MDVPFSEPGKSSLQEEMSECTFVTQSPVTMTDQMSAEQKVQDH